MSKWNILKSTDDVLVEKILDNLHALGIKDEICEELFVYAMYENYSSDTNFFISKILLKWGIEAVKEYLSNEIDKFDYQREREMLSFSSSKDDFEKAIKNYNLVKGLYKKIFS